MSHFEYTDEDGDKLTCRPLYGGVPFILLKTGPNGCAVSLDRVEEVVAGTRDMARQTGGQPAPARRRLTELEHTAAWHAIEGAAGEEGADPGTVLAAVLRALNIDPPEVDEMAASLHRDGFGDHEIAEILARPRAAEGAGA
ncbi:hypothetical protein ACIPJK_23725 [Streptomyces roseus]|uniref:hypothetical protein n=1 Tax=Streptomyces roseus TaxID=66430 RepID=UPI0038102BEE